MSLTLADYEKLNPRCEIVHAGTRMVFATPNLFTKDRVDTIYQKEPITLEWIGSFQTGETLIDVGANVGMYSIWAAATRKAQVIAFEPEAQNYALLNRNILANQLEGLIKAYCMGLSDHQGLTELHMHDLRTGGSNHAVGDALDFKHEPMPATFRQGCVVSRLDALVAASSIPMPNHIKIDVDGFEPRVIAGARGFLTNPALKSLLIETNLNLNDHRQMVSDLNGLGFKHDAEQVRRSMRNEGPFKGVAEHVFKR